jgi:hypothetical protein
MSENVNNGGGKWRYTPTSLMLGLRSEVNNLNTGGGKWGYTPTSLMLGLRSEVNNLNHTSRPFNKVWYQVLLPI